MRISDWSSDVCSSDLDVLFIGAFTRSAQTAYALSNLSRRGGAVTVLGGPHARCYPQDAAKYFDYVLGFTDKPLIADLLSHPAQQRPLGVQLKAARQPAAMPNLRARSSEERRVGKESVSTCSSRWSQSLPKQKT